MAGWLHVGWGLAVIVAIALGAVALCALIGAVVAFLDGEDE